MPAASDTETKRVDGSAAYHALVQSAVLDGSSSELMRPEEVPQARSLWTVRPEPATYDSGFPEDAVFIGREAEFSDLEAVLLPRSDVVSREAPRYALQGMPGVGKSFLVDRFTLRHREAFAGGCVRIVLAPDERCDLDTLREVVARQMDLTRGDSTSWDLINKYLTKRPTLIHIENVDGPLSAASAAQLARMLSRATVIITGRYRGLGESAGWRCRTVESFDAATARLQLDREFRPPNNDAEAAEFEGLVRELGGLPLAVHLAAGYLRQDQTPRDFLALLRQEVFRTAPSDPADPLLHQDHERAILESTFNLSLKLLGTIFQSDAVPQVRGYCALGFAPQSGFGRSLGVAISGLSEEQFVSLRLHARRLSILEPVRNVRNPEVRWRIHPLLAEVLRTRVDRTEVQPRITEWFMSRFPLHSRDPERQRRNHIDIETEFDALTHWLAAVDVQNGEAILETASAYASVNGPFRDWSVFCERILAGSPPPDVRRRALLLLSGVARQVGLFERARRAAEECAVLSQEAGDYRMSADARLSQAHASSVSGRPAEALEIVTKNALPALTDVQDIWQRVLAVSYKAHLLAESGDCHQALAIWQTQVIPMLEKGNATIPRAITLGQVANVLIRLGQDDRAMRILRNEVLPVLEEAGQPREFAVALDAVAVVQSRRERYDEALSIWRDQVIPIFERLGNVSDRTVMQGKVAGVLAQQGKRDEALRLLQNEILPAFKTLDNPHGLGVTLNQIATLRAEEGALDEAISIRLNEVLPLAEKLGERREIAITRYNAAQELVERDRPGDRAKARDLYVKALQDARAMRLPEAGSIERKMLDAGFADEVVALRMAYQQIVGGRSARAPGRNDLCPCGSGRKFKRCHGRP